MNISRLFHTIRYLQTRQVWFRMWYPIKKIFYREDNIPAKALKAAADFPKIDFITIAARPCFEPADNSFCFLNIRHHFGQNIDWDFPGRGRLWTYNLNYFDWLQDESVSVNNRLQTIYQYIGADPATGKEPYPISLRGINWIQFLVKNNIRDQRVDSFLYQSYRRLSAFPEYHIGANHLLENAFSLFFAATYFNNPKWFRQAKKLLIKELLTQILPDGGHCERSPMYHCILLRRLMACYELAEKNTRFSDEELQLLLSEKSMKMLGWLKAFVFADGSYAMVNDAAPGIAPSPETLFRYAEELELTVHPAMLNQSGYRHIKGKTWELLLNLGAPSPSYQPGHAHADALSFCLQANGRPLIADTGISTYEPGMQRLREKSTNAHNTIEIENCNSSDIWHGFRVGKRARVYITGEQEQSVTAYHDGYRDIDVTHRRTFRWTHEKIIIEDEIKNIKGRKALLHLHFHPDVLLLQTGKNQFSANGIRLRTEGNADAQLQEYQFCAGFNERVKAQRLRLCAADRIAIVFEF